MKILVDADACPVRHSIVTLGKSYDIPVVMVTDVSHIIEYTETHVNVVTVDQGADSADLAIANRCQAGDIAITGDYGLASLLLGKKAIVLHPNGFFYSLDTIDQMLFQRHISRELRRQKKGRSAPIPKRTQTDDIAFHQSLEKVLKKISTKELN